ncbi:protein giant [Uranotaenia lowii]|uniref:protein giant n=1 Tax=Uranotaenia lowii TaxID=190385 RepID=UPI002478CF8F|nr:protein giant [Uranotaenia lowii]
MMAQFMMDLKAEHRTSPSLYQANSPKSHDNYRPDSTDSGVLDLSKRRDSIDTRKTPSPYGSFSEGGSPPLHSSPINPLNYHGIQHQHQNLSPKPLLSYGGQNHLELRHALPAGFHPAPTYPMVIPKQENLPHRPELASYLLQAGAISHHATFPRSPLHQNRETDSLSESGSEGPLITKLKQSNEAPPQGNNGSYPMVVGRDGKLARPFKAYPRDPLSLAAGFMANDSMLDNHSAEKYNMFRKRMLEQIHAANGGQPTVSNPKMRRLNKSLSDASETESVPEKHPEISESHPTTQSQSSYEPLVSQPTNHSNPNMNNNGAATITSSSSGNSGTTKDSAYYERRKKNNAAAKKSRDRRRIKEDEIAIRAAFLERENIELKIELAAARKQLALYGVGGGSP